MRLLKGSRRATTLPDTLAPRLFGWYTPVSEPDMVIIDCSEDMSPVATSLSAFTADNSLVTTAKTFIGLTYDNNLIKLQVSSNFVPGDQFIFSYAQPGSNKLQDVGGNLLPSFTDYYVANQFPVPATPAQRKTGQTLYTEGGGGLVQISPTFFTCQVTTADFPTHAMWLNDEGWIEFQVTDSAASIRAVAMQLGSGSTLDEKSFSVRLASASVRAYKLGVAQGSAYAFGTPSALCRVRLYRALPSGTLTMDTSEDGGISWATRHTFDVLNEASEIIADAYTSSTTNAIVGCALQGYADRGF